MLIMKKLYPSYEKGSTSKLENKLSKHNKEIFDKYITSVSATAGKQKQF
jgi:hypothetical protein